MDHEFGSSQLQEYQVGWDWFSIQLDNRMELMFYQIRHKDGKIDPYSSEQLSFLMEPISISLRKNFRLKSLTVEKLKERSALSL